MAINLEETERTEDLQDTEQRDLPSSLSNGHFTPKPTQRGSLFQLGLLMAGLILGGRGTSGRAEQLAGANGAAQPEADNTPGLVDYCRQNPDDDKFCGLSFDYEAPKPPSLPEVRRPMPMLEQDPAEVLQNVLSSFDSLLDLGSPSKPEQLLDLPVMSPELKSKIAEYLPEVLRRIGQEDHFDQIRWFRYVRILDAIDPGVASQFSAESEERLSRYLESQDPVGGNLPLQELDQIARKAYSLMPLLSDEGREMCRALIDRVDREVRSVGTAEIADLVEADILDVQITVGSHWGRAMFALQEASDGKAAAGVEHPLYKFEKKLRENGSFEAISGEDIPEHGGTTWVYLHEPRSEEGAIYQWGVEYREELGRVTFRNFKGTAIVTVDIERFAQAVVERTVGDIVERGIASLESEQDPAGSALLSDFDLNDKGPVTYLRVFPEEFDIVTGAHLHHSMLLANILESRYEGQFRTDPVLFTNTPNAELLASVERGYQEGSRHFAVDFFNHGNVGDLAFEEAINAEDLADIARRFPDCHFTIRTIACYGGGLREGFLEIFEKEPELEQRISIFLGTKPDLPNLVYAGDPEVDEWILTTRAFPPTVFELRLMEALLDPGVRTFGEAVQRADRTSKEHGVNDAEEVIDGVLISQADSPHKAGENLVEASQRI